MFFLFAVKMKRRCHFKQSKSLNLANFFRAFGPGLLRWENIKCPPSFRVRWGPGSGPS